MNNTEKYRHDCEVRYWRKLFQESDLFAQEKYIGALKSSRSPKQFRQLMDAIFSTEKHS